MNIWYRLDKFVPSNGEVCYIRVTDFYSEPFLAIYSTSLQGFTSQATNIFFANAYVARWKYSSGSIPAIPLSQRMAESYAKINSIDVTSSVWITDYLPIFATIFDPGYTDSLGTGYYFTKYFNFYECNFLIILKGYFRGTASKTYSDYADSSGCRILNYYSNVAYNSVVPGTDIRSGSNVVIISSFSSFKYFNSPSGFDLFEHSSNWFLPSLYAPLFSTNSGWNNSADCTVLNTFIRNSWSYLQQNSNLLYQHIKGPSALFLNYISTGSFTSVTIKNCSFTSIQLMDAFYSSSTFSQVVIDLSLNLLPTAEIDRLMHDIYVKMSITKAGLGIKKSLTVSLNGNVGYLTGGTSNADYVNLVALFVGTGFSVTINI